MTIEGFAGPFRNWLLRPQIVHRLPGRLRLRVPAIRQIDHAQQEWAFVWRDLLGGTDEIESVEVSPTTGSVLIRYDPDRLTEAELLAFLHAVNRVVLQHWNRLAALPAAELPEALRRLVRAIRAGMRHRLVLDDKLEISTDV
jgi:hypothetical protein